MIKYVLPLFYIINSSFDIFNKVEYVGVKSNSYEDVKILFSYISASLLVNNTLITSYIDPAEDIKWPTSNSLGSFNNSILSIKVKFSH